MHLRLPRWLLALLLIPLGSAAFAAAPDRFAGVPAAVQPFVDKGEIAGAVMLVADREKVLHLSAVGQSDLAGGRRMEPGDLFWIASMSKPITATGVALLVDDGKLSFDDPVEKYLPEFHGIAGATRPITLRDLLTHTSGLGEYRVTDPHWTLAQMAQALARLPLKFAPGSKWSYSTAGIDTLGRVVEVASGKPFAEFMQQRLFDPLGMTHTTFWPTEEQKKHLATSYVLNAQTGKLQETVISYLYGGAITDAARPPLGGAGLFSTAEDVAKFYQMLLKGGVAGGKQILKPATLAEMTRKQTGELRARVGMPWGLGFCVVEDPTQMEANRTFTPGTFGHGGAYGTQSWADPTRGIVYVFMIQRDKIPNNPDNSPMRQAYQTAVESALKP